MTSETREMFRTEWVGRVDRETLRQAIDRKTAYHSQRIAFWIEQRAECETQIRAKGLELRKREFTGGYDFEAVLDTELGKRLAECQRKLDEHTRQREVFADWRRFTELLSNSLLHVTIDDVRYFGIGEAGESP